MMTEDQVLAAIQEILANGLLIIRKIAIDFPDLAESEADHLHNLPYLLNNFSVELLKFYFDIERESYLKGAHHEMGPIRYKESWLIIADFLNQNFTGQS